MNRQELFEQERKELPELPNLLLAMSKGWEIEAQGMCKMKLIAGIAFSRILPNLRIEHRAGTVG